MDHSTYCMQFLISQCLLLQGGPQHLLHAVPHQSLLLVAGWTTALTACSSSSVSACCCRVDHSTYCMQFLISHCFLLQGGPQHLLHVVPHQSVLLVAGWTTALTACRFSSVTASCCRVDHNTYCKVACSSSSVSACCCRMDHSTYCMQFLISQCLLLQGGPQHLLQSSMQFLVSQCLLLQDGPQYLLHAVPHQSVLVVAGWTTTPTPCSSSSISSS